MTNLHKFHVPSGSYIADSTKPLMLHALLGTCVAVAVFDSRKGVGGILHALLPEPVSSVFPPNPEKYVSTGLPQFLKALYSMGATPQNMTCHIAGGALLQPLNKQDIFLNIGGRSADIAGKILKAEGIQTIKSETGGFFGYSLNLDMEKWVCDVSPAISIDTRGAGQATPNPNLIKQAVADLQPIPQIIFSILKMIHVDTYTYEDMAAEVKKDQVLSAKTLKVSNSALFSLRKQIDSIDDAIAILGQDLFSKLVISFAVKNYFDRASSGYSLSKGGLYHHALGTAIIAEKVASMNRRVPPTVAYTAGLLHDIGKVALDQFVMASSPLFYRMLMAQKKNIIDAENEILGVNHADIGEHLAEEWDFPESIIQVIRTHHRKNFIAGKDDLNAIIALSNLLMHMFNAGPELYRVNTANLEHLMEANGFKLTMFPDIIDAIPVQALSSSPELAIVQG